MTKIFISYRRADSQETTDRLHDQMTVHFGDGNVFQDVDNIPFGVDFRKYLQAEIAKCDVVLVIIGTEWTRIMGERAHEPNDFVRIEVESALRLGKLIVPVTIRGVGMPNPSDLPESIRDICWLNAARVRPNPDFRNDCRRLADGIKAFLAENPLTPQPPLPQGARGSDSGGQTTPPPPAPKPSAEQAPKTEQKPPTPTRQTPLLPQEARWSDSLGQTKPQTFSYEEDLNPQLMTSLSMQQKFKIAPKPDPVQQALTRARDFHETGKRNADWKPFYVTFSDLKIPDMRFCLVPTGSFQMGKDKDAYDGKTKGVSDGGKQTFNQPFYIAQYPVTNAQWTIAVRSGAVKEPQDEDSLEWYKDPKMANAPVVGVSWFECQKFALWADCQLPTEREWEYAARGVDSLTYPWGNAWDRDRAVWIENSEGQPWDVITKADGASWVGAYHLSGNVWEWVASEYDVYPYQADGRREPDMEDRSVMFRVLRGGSWNFNDFNLRSSDRNFLNPDNFGYMIGFRLTRSS